VEMQIELQSDAVVEVEVANDLFQLQIAMKLVELLAKMHENEEVRSR
jgi:antitoxin component of MazEF toxin-antitoxin module